MFGTTLLDIREHVEDLANENGTYGLRCARTGEEPIPATGLRFADRATARTAAGAVEQYRAALRRYDPQFPFANVIVCEEADPQIRSATASDRPPARSLQEDSRATVTLAGEGSERDHLIEFCHRVAAAVFEALSAGTYRAVETAVMDAYFEHAERVTDPDELCVCLLESMAAELAAGLDARDQLSVLRGAAARLQSPDAGADPITATFARLQRLGLLDTVRQSPATVDTERNARLIAVTVSEYALSPSGGRLPVLPVVVDLCRYPLDRPIAGVRAIDAGDGWTLAIAFGEDLGPTALSAAPIADRP